MNKPTPEIYRVVALNHIRAAEDLWDNGHYVLANYISGLAVECIFRAYALRLDREQFETVAHHDLNIWFRNARFTALIPSRNVEVIGQARTTLDLNWNNSQRYCFEAYLQSEFKRKKIYQRVRGNLLKEVTKTTLDAARQIILLGERQWSRFDSIFRSLQESD